MNIDTIPRGALVVVRSYQSSVRRTYRPVESVCRKRHRRRDAHPRRRCGALSIPPSIIAARALGFGLYLGKCVLDGKGEAGVDLAKTNLRDRIFSD